jgi:hypothetical protein
MPTNDVGILAKTYVRTGGTFASPTWTELKLVRDENQNSQHDVVEILDRSTTVKREAPTTTDLSNTGAVRFKPGDSAYDAVRTGHMSKAPVDMMFLTGASTNEGEVGYRYEALVSSMNQNRGISDALYDSFKFAPHARSANPVQSVAVVAGAPVFTTI